MKCAWRWVLIIGLLNGLTPTVLAYTAKAQGGASRIVRIKRIDHQKRATPEYQVKRTREGAGRIRQWVQITTRYETAPEWIDQLDFRYYAVVRTKSGDRRYQLLSGEVAYVNVKKGSHESVVFIHPSSIDRFGVVEHVAVEIRVRSQLVGMASDRSGNERWWEQMSPKEGYILTRDESVFALINYDNYEAIKP